MSNYINTQDDVKAKISKYYQKLTSSNDEQKNNVYKNKLKYYDNLLQNNFTGGAPRAATFSEQDEVHFWMRQIMEHALFLHLGIEDSNNDFKFKTEALEHYNKFNKFLDEHYYSKGIKVDADTVELSAKDLTKVKPFNQTRVKELINGFDEFNRQIIKKLKAGVWIGWIFPSLAEHMQKETEYFKKKLSNQYTQKQEIDFINEHHKEELMTTAHLFDPTEDTPFNTVKALANKDMTNPLIAKFQAKKWSQQDLAALQGMSKSDVASYLMISIQYGKSVVAGATDTGEKLKANKIKSVIHPMLAAHALREYKRMTKTLEMLK